MRSQQLPAPSICPSSLDATNRGLPDYARELQRVNQIDRDNLFLEISKLSQAIGEVKLKHNETDEKIDHLNKLLTGNGTPEKGIIVRLDRLEQATVSRKWLMRTTIVACIAAIISTISHWLKGI